MISAAALIVSLQGRECFLLGSTVDCEVRQLWSDVTSQEADIKMSTYLTESNA